MTIVALIGIALVSAIVFIIKGGKLSKKKRPVINTEGDFLFNEYESCEFGELFYDSIDITILITLLLHKLVKDISWLKCVGVGGLSGVVAFFLFAIISIITTTLIRMKLKDEDNGDYDYGKFGHILLSLINGGLVSALLYFYGLI